MLIERQKHRKYTIRSRREAERNLQRNSSNRDKGCIKTELIYGLERFWIVVILKKERQKVTRRVDGLGR